MLLTGELGTGINMLGLSAVAAQAKSGVRCVYGAVGASAEDSGMAIAGELGAFYTLVPIRPRWRGERRFLRTFAGVSLRLPLAFNPRPRCLSTSTDAFEFHPDVRLYRTALSVVRETGDGGARFGPLGESRERRYCSSAVDLINKGCRNET